MKIELIKKEDNDGIWYYTYINGAKDKIFTRRAEAEERYEYLVINAKTEPKIEVLRTIDI